MLLKYIKIHLLLWPIAVFLAFCLDKRSSIDSYLIIMTGMTITSCFREKKYNQLLLNFIILPIYITAITVKQWWFSLTIFIVFVIFGVTLLYLEKRREKK